MEEPISKRHHFVPRSYLAFFTKEFSKDSEFQVYSIENGKTWPSSPNGVAVENNFDSFEAEGHRTDVFEKGVISDIESDASKAIRAISEQKVLPDDAQHLAILYLMGLLAARNPQSRALRDAVKTREIEIIFGMIADDEKLFKSQIERARKNGASIPKNISFTEFKNYIEETEISAKHSTTSHLDFELRTVDELTSMLWDRYWSLIVLEDESHEFICSDHPISLRSKFKTSRSFGYKTPNTEVFFPLTNKLGYFGVYEDPKHEIVGLNKRGVASFNSRTKQTAQRQIFSRSESYLVLDDGAPIRINLRNG